MSAFIIWLYFSTFMSRCQGVRTWNNCWIMFFFCFFCWNWFFEM